jgi:hypothetical protein
MAGRARLRGLLRNNGPSREKTCHGEWLRFGFAVLFPIYHLLDSSAFR